MSLKTCLWIVCLSSRVVNLVIPLKIDNADLIFIIQTLIYWSSSELVELEGSAVLNKIKKDDADESFKRLLLPVVQQQPELFGRHSQEFAQDNASTVLLDLAHRMASLIMAYGFDIEKDSFSSEEEDDEEEADGSSQLAYELNKGMVPLADLFNAGMYETWSNKFLICTVLIDLVLWLLLIPQKRH